MLSNLRKRVSYANVAMTIAIVLAMGGGAYAANKFVITSIKQIKPSVVAQLKGKAGKAGPVGSQGPVGPQGPKGENGAPGTNGKDGVNGQAGSVGATGPAGATGATGPKGATGTTGSQGAIGTQGATGPGGATGPTGAAGAQGASGPKGATGEPWTPNGTLPSKASEAGQWATYSSAAGEFSFASAVVSIPIPLKAALTEEHVYFVGPGEAEGEGKENKKAFPAHCKGKVGTPVAEPGNLCIFAASVNNLQLAFLLDQETNGSGASGRTGTTLIFASAGAGPASAGGTWVVTEK